MIVLALFATFAVGGCEVPSTGNNGNGDTKGHSNNGNHGNGDNGNHNGNSDAGNGNNGNGKGGKGN